MDCRVKPGNDKSGFLNHPSAPTLKNPEAEKSQLGEESKF